MIIVCSFIVLTVIKSSCALCQLLITLHLPWCGECGDQLVYDKGPKTGPVLVLHTAKWLTGCLKLHMFLILPASLPHTILNWWSPRDWSQQTRGDYTWSSWRATHCKMMRGRTGGYYGGKKWSKFAHWAKLFGLFIFHPNCFSGAYYPVKQVIVLPLSAGIIGRLWEGIQMGRNDPVHI